MTQARTNPQEPIPPAAWPGPPWIGPVRHRTEIDTQWLLIAAVMLASGLLYFGWRAMTAVCLTALSALAAFVLCRIVARIIRPNGPHESTLHALGLGLLLGLSMPAVWQVWMPVLAGVLLGIGANFLGRSHRLRVHPVAATIVLLWLLPVVLIPFDSSILQRHGFDTVPAVLKPRQAVLGDLHDIAPLPTPRPWWAVSEQTDPVYAALRRQDPYLVLLKEQQVMLRHRQHLVDMLSSGQLPRMGELLLGAVAGPIGASSPALVILLGLFLLYRRQGWWPLPLIALAAALAALMVMPMRTGGTGERWGVTLPLLIELGPRAATTFLAYAILASPLPLIVMILAPMTAPMSRGGRAIYAVILGVMTVTATWLTAAPPAAMVSLVIAGVLSRPLDSLHRSRFVGPRQ